jgi:hypothetical protein
MAKFTKREILEFLMTNDLDSTIYILSRLNLNIKNIPRPELESLKIAIRTLKSKRNAKFQAARMPERFESNNAVWLNSGFSVALSLAQHSISSSHSINFLFLSYHFGSVILHFVILSSDFLESEIKLQY